MYNQSDPKSVEKYSSAVTMSDMELFIFPELMFSLVLSNIMSPLLWEWRNDPWFDGMDKLNPYRRILRAKQYIMDHFDFNLDLDTWGLTTKERELSRFSEFVDESVLSKSNALFGYEGDKYYFDIDIRRHFGLDKYTSNVIPYWKTETIEAMAAFKYKEGYPHGAGECVSLAGLYASAMYVLAGISLNDIYLMATPLHSQNFIDIKEGLITNNRRIVTKNMWFNGTELSDKARRALLNEQVTIVAHPSGYIHTLYPEATIDPDVYARFSTRLQGYCKTDITFEILSSFLRQNPKVQKCFQLRHACCGKPRYIEAEKVFHYEHNSKSRIGEATQSALLHEIDEDEFYPSSIQNRLILDEVETFFKGNPVPIDDPGTVDKLRAYLQCGCYHIDEVIRELIFFCKIEPKLPATSKEWRRRPTIDLDTCHSPDEVIAYLESIRKEQPIADLAFAAFRDLKRSPWKPFMKAALERNPVSIELTKNYSVEEIVANLSGFANESIYGTSRLAQPDEVWNFRRGDGLEKAICLMNILRSRMPQSEIVLHGDGSTIDVSIDRSATYRFVSSKGLILPELSDY
jgi:hypothetical protein